MRASLSFRAFCGVLLVGLVCMLLNVDGYMELHGLHPPGKSSSIFWRIFADFLVPVAATLLFIWAVFKHKRDAAIFWCAIVLASVFCYVIRFPSTAQLDAIRFSKFSDQERFSIQQMREAHPELQRQIVLFSWGDWGFAGNNLFSFLAHTKNTEAIFKNNRGSLRFSDLRAVYLAADGTVVKNYTHKRDCMASSTRLSREYFILRADC